MNRTPWNSIVESLVNSTTSKTLGILEALESPCMNCETTPCCTHLPLNNFKISNLMELDHALYLLNFNNIELGVSASGEWSSYYTYPCRFLDRQTFKCKVHATNDQPRICQHYNPYNCWYKKVFIVGQREEFIRIDYDRMQYLLPFIEFNEQRQIVAVPEWDDLIAMMEAYDDQARVFEEYNLSDRAFSEWEQQIFASEAALPQPDYQRKWFEANEEPCTGCEAYCCKTLVFPQSVPQHISNLDYFRFCLGFPGVELGVGEGGWSLVVKTQCRYLDADHRCVLFDLPGRPLICKYYDAWKCDYKPQFGHPRPQNFFRLRLEQFLWIMESIPVDENGAVGSFPSVDVLRQSIEAKWKAAGHQEDTVSGKNQTGQL